MKPLTIEQLKSLEVGDWVWIKDLMADRGMYAQICVNAQGVYLAGKNYGVFPNYSDYGTNWVAYKNKECAEAKGEIVELPYAVLEHEKQAVREFAEKVKPITDDLVELMFNNDEPNCKVDDCEKPSDIPCGSSICIEENKQIWKSKIDELLAEVKGE